MIVSFLTKQVYYSLFIYFLVSFLIGTLILVISYFLILQKPDSSKLSAYECGFDPFGDSRDTFNIHFYLVGILFIIFDLEIMFLFPWAVTLHISGSFGFFVMFLFLLILMVGFIYEWLKGALDWS